MFVTQLLNIPEVLLLLLLLLLLPPPPSSPSPRHPQLPSSS